MLWSLIVLAGTPTGDPVVTVGLPLVTLTKMEPHDNPKAFLELFEQTAEEWELSDEQ